MRQSEDKYHLLMSPLSFVGLCLRRGSVRALQATAKCKGVVGARS